MPRIMRGSNPSMFDFAPRPNDEQIREVVLNLCRMTRWGLNEALNLTYDEAVWWLEGAINLEREIVDALESKP